MNIVSNLNLNRHNEKTKVSRINGRRISTIRKTSHNIWDEEWEVGSYDYQTGLKYNNNDSIRCKNFVKVSPNENYYFKNPTGTAQLLLYYDENKNYLSYFANSSNSTFTTPYNCAYMAFFMSIVYGTTYHNDISINYPATFTSYEPHILGSFYHAKKVETSKKTKSAVEVPLKKLRVHGNITQESGYAVDFNQLIENGNFAISSRLPSGYTELEYLQSSGTSFPYIDTGYVPTINTKARVKFCPINTNGTGFFGARRDNENARFCCTTFSSGTTFAFAMTNSTWSSHKTNVVTGTIYDCTAYNGKQIINRTEYTEPTVSTFSTTYTFKLAPINGSGEPSTGGNSIDIKFYLCQIWNNDSLVRNFIPCYHKVTGIIGMYETVTNTFFTNAGSGTFTAGPEVERGGWELYQNTCGELLIQNNKAIITYNGTAEADYSQGLRRHSINAILNHKYCVFFKIKSSISNSIYYELNGVRIQSVDGIIANQEKDVAILFTCTNKYTSDTLIFPSGVVASGTTIEISNFMLIDLTQMFGSGNEPTTTAQFKTMYPNAYYDYTTSTWQKATSGKTTNHLYPRPQLPIQPSRISKLYVGGVNQIVAPSDISGSRMVFGTTITNNGDGSITLSGTSTRAFSTTFVTKNVIGNHKYLIVAPDNICFTNSITYYTNYGSYILNVETSRSMGLLWYDLEGKTFNNITCYPMIIDLTQMYGAGNEPTSVDEVKKDIAPNLVNGYLPYQSNSRTADIYPLSTGDIFETRTDLSNNIWDEVWENGVFNENTGANITNANQIRSKNYIPVKANKKYYIYCGKTMQDYIWFMAFDENKNVIATPQMTQVANGNLNGVSTGNGIIETPSNCVYIRFYTTLPYGTTYGKDISILPIAEEGGIWNGKVERGGWATDGKTSWINHYRNKELIPILPNSNYYVVGDLTDGVLCYDLNGDYLRAFYPSDSLFNSGADACFIGINIKGRTYQHNISINKAYYQKYQDLNGMGLVDLGSIEWVYIDGAFGNFTQITDRKTYAFEKSVNAFCSTYSVNTLALYNGDPRFVDKQIMINWSNTTVWIKDSDYTDATTFKNALSGKLLHYELKPEYTQDKVIIYKKFGIQNLGDLEWNYDNANNRFWATITGMIASVPMNVVPNVKCRIYRAVTGTYFNQHHSESYIFRLEDTERPYIYIRDLDYTDATAFKTAMDNVYLIYELATPVTTITNVFNTEYLNVAQSKLYKGTNTIIARQGFQEAEQTGTLEAEYYQVEGTIEDGYTEINNVELYDVNQLYDPTTYGYHDIAFKIPTSYFTEQFNVEIEFIPNKEFAGWVDEETSTKGEILSLYYNDTQETGIFVYGIRESEDTDTFFITYDMKSEDNTFVFMFDWEATYTIGQRCKIKMFVWLEWGRKADYIVFGGIKNETTSPIKIEHIKITEAQLINGKKMQLIPAVRNDNNKCGLYDLNSTDENEKFITSEVVVNGVTYKPKWE